MGVILRLGTVLILCAVVSLAFGVLSGHFAARASAGYARNLRRKMYYAVQDFSFSNIDRFSSASLVTRLTTDVTNVQHAYQMIMSGGAQPCHVSFFVSWPSASTLSFPWYFSG